MPQTRAPAETRRIIGQRLRELRKEAGMTTMDVAIALGTGIGSIEQIEQGKSSIRGENLPVLAHLFKMDLGELAVRLLDDLEYNERRIARSRAFQEIKEETAF